MRSAFWTVLLDYSIEIALYRHMPPLASGTAWSCISAAFRADDHVPPRFGLETLGGLAIPLVQDIKWRGRVQPSCRASGSPTGFAPYTPQYGRRYHWGTFGVDPLYTVNLSPSTAMHERSRFMLSRCRSDARVPGKPSCLAEGIKFCSLLGGGINGISTKLKQC